MVGKYNRGSSYGQKLFSYILQFELTSCYLYSVSTLFYLFASFYNIKRVQIVEEESSHSVRSLIKALTLPDRVYLKQDSAQMLLRC